MLKYSMKLQKTIEKKNLKKLGHNTSKTNSGILFLKKLMKESFEKL